MLKICCSIALVLAFLNTNAQINQAKTDSLKMILRSSFDIVKKYSVYRNEVDWNIHEALVLGGIDILTSYDSLVVRTQALFAGIADNHGALFFNGARIDGNMKPKIMVREALRNPFKPHNATLKTAMLADGIGYMLVIGDNMQDNIQALAQALQDSLCRLNPAKLKGIIIDLRLHEGGSVYPMFTGLHQLIGDGVAGAFTDYKGIQKNDWFLKKGRFYQGKKIIASVKPGCDCSSKLKVAVLQSQITASAGEMLAIALKGRKHMVFIGEQTYGLVSANSVFKVHGQTLAVATSFTADRTGKIYRESLQPDIEMVEGDDFNNLEKDKKVEAAVWWIKGE